MKTITFFKRVLASAALVSVCGFACATNNGKQFIHNDTMEGGKLVCREIYAMILLLAAPRQNCSIRLLNLPPLEIAIATIEEMTKATVIGIL